MELSQFLPLSITFVITLLGSYMTIKVTIAELKKDMAFLRDKIESEVQAKNKLETTHQGVINEVRDDVKAIFRTLTKMQVDQAKNEGQESVIKALKEAIIDLNNKR
jgi:hypothetical protein